MNKVTLEAKTCSVIFKPTSFLYPNIHKYLQSSKILFGENNTVSFNRDLSVYFLIVFIPRIIKNLIEEKSKKRKKKVK